MINCSNGKISIKFNEEKATLISINDSLREYVSYPSSIFEILVRDKSGDEKRVESENFSLEKSSFSSCGFTCIYKGDFGLKVTLAMELSDEIRWSISSEVSDGYVTEWIRFPLINVPHDLGDNDGNGKILWGFNEGVIVDNLSERERKVEYVEPTYPYVSFMGMYPAIVGTQFMAYYNNTSGMYFASHDRDDHLKEINFRRCGDGIRLLFTHFCGEDFGESFELSYPVVMKFFEGDWYKAADIYRTWFEKERAHKFIAINKNKNLPGWYGESPVVITYPVRGIHDMDEAKPNKMFPYINAMPHVERLEKEFGSKIMVLLMHWEGSAPWAPPYVWPPFGGEAELGKFIDALHERGDVIGVYCSGLGWTHQSNIIKEYNTQKQFDDMNLSEAMCLSPKQELPFCKICEGQRSGYDMCPSHPFAVKTLKKEVESMANAGIDYIQLMDQNHGGTSHFCYSKSHSHPPVPGKWQVDAMKKLYEEITENCGNVLLGTESAAAESYIPHLMFSDNRFLLNYQIGKPVPAYAYVFHEYVNNFMGNQVCINFLFDHQKSPENILMRTAYAFAAGDMLTAVLNQDGDITWNWGQLSEADRANLPEQQNIKTLIRNLNFWRTGKGKKYLHTGKMVKPYHVECGKNLIHYIDGNTKAFDRIFTSAWENGSFGQFIINYNPEDTFCKVNLPDGVFRVYSDETHYENLSGGVNEITVPALSALLIEQ